MIKINQELALLCEKYGLADASNLEEVIEFLSTSIRLLNIEFVHGRDKHKTQLQRDYEKLYSYLERLENYYKSLEICGKRKSYSKTDTDATFMRMKDGNPYLIEVTPRLDGCHMWKLIDRYCGINLFNLTMKHFFGEDIEIGEYEKSIYPMHLEFFCEPPETIFNENKYRGYFADYSVMYYGTGDTVRKLNGYMEKCGYRIYKSPHTIGVIGGSGFVGRSFEEQYGKRLTVKNISRSNGSVTEYSEKQLEEALSGCDSVVLLAGKKVRQDEKQSLSLYSDNIAVVENTLKACCKLGITNIVFTSSRCVYSNEQNVPITENGIISPINYYGISKATAELLCTYYNKNLGFKIKILRLAQIIGKDKNGYMTDRFISNALSNRPLTVYGKAVGRRDYIYIKDVCKAIYRSLESYSKSGIYNIGSGKGTSSKELAEAVIYGLEE